MLGSEAAGFSLTLGQSRKENFASETHQIKQDRFADFFSHTQKLFNREDKGQG